jgi:predicted Rossmann fold nucleotide-binding protein DprA/Smf involved in DNA uptake
LIRDGAVLTTCLEDIVNNLDPLPAAAMEPTLFEDVEVVGDVASAKPQAEDAPTAARSRPPVGLNLTERQQLIVSQLDGNPLHVDQLIERTSLSASDILQDLTLLSLKGVVRRVDGQTYVRTKAGTQA